MSVSSFQLLRYRAFRDEQRVGLRPITLVLGRNNVGKSALLRAPHFLTLPLSTRAAEVPFPLSEDGFGTHAWTFDEVTWDRDPRGFVGEIEWAGRKVRVGATSIPEQRHRQHLLELSVDGQPVDVAGGWPAARQRLAALLDIGRDACWNLVGIRQPAKHRYPFRGAEVSGPGVDGSLAPYQVLQGRDDGTIRLLNEWATRLLGCRFEVDDERDDFAVWVRAGASAPRVNLASCGDGIGQVLPILTLLLLTPRAARPGLLCLEQPDLHLHPRAHAELGDLMIHCTNQDPDLRLLVECHSDVLLLRLRRRVAEGLDPNRIGVLYVDQADDGASTLREIKLNTRGVPDWWPSGVFEEAPQEYLAMRRHLSRHVP